MYCPNREPSVALTSHQTLSLCALRHPPLKVAERGDHIGYLKKASGGRAHKLSRQFDPEAFVCAFVRL
jgi:hypothetical protein